MPMKILVACASTDGQTRKICRVAADWTALKAVLTDWTASIAGDKAT